LSNKGPIWQAAKFPLKPTQPSAGWSSIMGHYFYFSYILRIKNKKESKKRTEQPNDLPRMLFIAIISSSSTFQGVSILCGRRG
jgi:hypothetical protein